MLHMAGDGVPYDEEEGMRWLRRAAELGDPDAKAALPGFEEMLRVRMSKRAPEPRPHTEEVAN
jgi:TPR repeat protein